MRSISAKALKISVFATCMFVMTACSANYKYHGYAPDDDELANIIIGADNRDTVRDVLGKPSSSGVLADGSFYYVASKVRHFIYRAPTVVERTLVAITFDESDTVQNIERFGLEDGRVVTLSRRVTELPVKGPGILQQILGNLGNFDLSSIGN